VINEAPAGLFQIEAGIQSVNPEVNRRIHRSTNLEKMKKAMDLIDRDKVHIHVDLIVGLPGEVMESFLSG
ncbi:MAG: radical SAM protein, partial [Aedoeadaptatus pacaensis]